MDQAIALDRIAKDIAKCSECKKEKSGLPVPGEGNPNADIMFLGEAPGKNEAKTGRPFIGRSGQLLRRMIREVGLQEEQIILYQEARYPSRLEVHHTYAKH